MRFTEKGIKAPRDFGSRFCCNLAHSLMNLKSFPYIATLERNVNAKSILGLLSLNIHKGDIILIQVVNDDDEQAKKDLDFVLSLIQGENNES